MHSEQNTLASCTCHVTKLMTKVMNDYSQDTSVMEAGISCTTHMH